MANVRVGINTIFQERNNFIIIGLTGRTGSGCSEVSNILSAKSFSSLNLKEPKKLDFKSNEERKYTIIYNYASKNWNEFETISMSDIIFTFILELEASKLKELFESIVGPESGDKIIKELNTEFITLFNNLHNELMSVLSENNRLKRGSNADQSLQKEYDLLIKVHEAQKQIKSELKKHTYEYNIDVEDKSEKTKKKCSANAYTYLYQQIGNNIRENGSVFKKEFTGHNMFDIARRANDFIKAIRNHNNTLTVPKPTLICLDAIRNPYEATYFKDRYSSFYLISVNTEDIERRARLNYLNKDQIYDLDRIEYPQKTEGIEVFTNQNISACLELSDIHIYNPHQNTPEKFFLTEQIVKYVMLMKHPGLITPTQTERCMQIAYNAKLNSGCLSRQVGATITDKKYSIKAVGWNDIPEGQVPCNLRDIKSFCTNKDRMSFSQFEIENEDFNKEISQINQKINYDLLNGRSYPYCFKDIYNSITKKGNQVHTRSLHAEENAFLQIVKNGGVGIEGGYLFTTASPCELCSKKAYQLGIECIYYIDPYPGISIPHILNFGENNPKNPKTQLFYGAIGKAYTELFSQRLSIKDELKMIIS
jgi:dCMP deaminase